MKENIGILPLVIFVYYSMPLNVSFVGTRNSPRIFEHASTSAG
jgi:hypothetical protein